MPYASEGITWHNNCAFFERQCLALAEGKFLWITGEGECSLEIDAVGPIALIGTLGPIGPIDAINETIDTGEFHDQGDNVKN
jgi:hypothetical protein